MVAAGLVAKKAVERGLKVKPHVKTSLSPGSRVVTDYFNKSGLAPYLDTLGFQTTGYGCMTCIGNSGPLPESISSAIERDNLAAVSVLSGNRNFEGRVNPHVKANYLASPPLVVAYALAGTIDIDFTTQPIGKDKRRRARDAQGHLADAGRGRRHDRPLDRPVDVQPAPTTASARRTTTGTRSPSRAASSSTLTRRAPTSRTRRSSTTSRPPV